MAVYHHNDDIVSTEFSPQMHFFSHQAKDWGAGFCEASKADSRLCQQAR
jgi:hypothetical protein